MTESIGAIVLAAGSSTRLGRPKQFIVYRGKPLVLRAVEAAANAGCAPIVVVAGRDTDPIIETLAGSPAMVVHNRDWQQGMGTSIRTGIETLMDETPDFAAVLLMVCDQPFVHENHLRLLIETWSRQKLRAAIIASSYCETLGTPALFDRSFTQDLRSLVPGKGARSLLQAHCSETISIPFAEGGFDVDTPEDYQQLLRVPFGNPPSAA